MAEPATKKAKSEAVSYSQQRAVVLGNIKALGVLKEEALRGEFTREDFLIFDQSLEIEISALTRLNNEQTGVADAKIDGLVASITEAVADLKSAQVADLKDCMRAKATAVCSAADKLSFEGIDRLHHAIGILQKALDDVSSSADMLQVQKAKGSTQAYLDASRLIR